MKEKRKKISERIFSIVSITLLLITMALFLFVVVSKSKNQVPRIFGYSLHFVVSDSMEDEIKVGDLVVGKKVGIMEIKEGDDILFVSPDPNLKGKVIVHRVRSIDDSDGERKIYTYGINNNKDDTYPVTAIIGRVTSVSTFWGRVFNPIGILFIVAAIILISIFYFSIKSMIKANRELKGQDDVDALDDSSTDNNDSIS